MARKVVCETTRGASSLEMESVKLTLGLAAWMMSVKITLVPVVWNRVCKTTMGASSLQWSL